MRQGDDGTVIDALHCLRGNHGIDDGFLGGLHSCEKDRVDLVIRQHGELTKSFARCGTRVGGGKRDKNVPGTVPRVTAVASQSQRDSSSYPFQLCRDERRIGSDHDDDGSDVVTPHSLSRYFLSHGNARYTQLATTTIVALHQHANGVATVFGVQVPGRRARAAFELITDHAGAATDISFLDRPALGRVKCVERVFRLYVEAIDVV